MALVGTGGSVYIGTNRVMEISQWSLDLGADDIDVTSFDSQGWKEFLAGLKEWSGSIEGNYVPGDTGGQKAIIAAWLNGQTVNFEFRVSDTVKFAGSALVKPSIETPVDDKVGFSVDIQGTGPLTVPA
ncbi:MAG: hypothetical protein H5U02_00600 [Clostridia bacterium]|nr:hypothetical protein [Clostridia bacterium]